jgi:hypothetical protein
MKRASWAHAVIAALVSANASASTIYVRTGAPDGGDGKTPGRAFNSLQTAALKSEASEDITTIVVLPGTYVLEGPIEVRNAGSHLTWAARPPKSVLLDGAGRAKAALRVWGGNVTITGFKVHNFAEDGIVIQSAHDVVIDNNEIAHIRSRQWSRGAVHGIGIATRVTVTHNVISDTDYAGVLFEAARDGDLRNNRIEGNRITQVCQRIADCGAIYEGGRASKSGGLIVAANFIRDYGHPEKATKGIYLDDGLSGAIVENNEVRGSGSFPLQIHGGSNNVVRNNLFCSEGPFLLYQKLNDRPMVNNDIRANAISSRSTRVVGLPDSILRQQRDGDRACRHLE